MCTDSYFKLWLLRSENPPAPSLKRSLNGVDYSVWRGADYNGVMQRLGLVKPEAGENVYKMLDDAAMRGMLFLQTHTDFPYVFYPYTGIEGMEGVIWDTSHQRQLPFDKLKKIDKDVADTWVATIYLGMAQEAARRASQVNKETRTVDTVGIYGGWLNRRDQAAKRNILGTAMSHVGIYAYVFDDMMVTDEMVAVAAVAKSIGKPVNVHRTIEKSPLLPIYEVAPLLDLWNDNFTKMRAQILSRRA